MRRDEARAIEFISARFERQLGSYLSLAELTPTDGNLAVYIRNTERNRSEAPHAWCQRIQDSKWVQPEMVLMLCHYITPTCLKVVLGQVSECHQSG